MASSFAFQIPLILHIARHLAPTSVLDIGKGFGKYGLLLHEYVGIDNTRRLDPSQTMVQQSRLRIDAAEADPELMLPHLSHFYNRIIEGDILENYRTLDKYDLVFMVDVIEHLDKERSIEMLRTFIKNGSNVLIATPVDFFQQHLYESEFEHHVSHWKASDFKGLGYLQKQYIENSAVYLLSPSGINIRGFGDSLVKKMRRLARAVRSEL